MTTKSASRRNPLGDAARSTRRAASPTSAILGDTKRSVAPVATSTASGRIPKVLHRRAKAWAAQHDMSFAEMIEQGLLLMMEGKR